MTRPEVVVVGAGAAGLTAALRAAEAGTRVLRAFPANASREWIESLGVALKLEETGKYFPESDDAQTVLDALLGAVERAGVSVRAGARVVRLERPSEDFELGIQEVRASAALGSGGVSGHGAEAWPLPSVAVDETLVARRVILAAGGLSFPRTGSDGTGYALAQSLGHTIVPPVPALTPLTADHPWRES